MQKTYLKKNQDNVYNGPQNILNQNLLIVTKSTENSLIRTYILTNPLISRCENLKWILNNAHLTYYYHAQYNGTFPERKYYKYPN